MGHIQVYQYGAHGEPLQLAKNLHYYPFDFSEDTGEQRYFRRVVTTGDKPYKPDDAQRPVYNQRSFVLRKYVDTEVGGYYRIENDTKVDGKYYLHNKVAYDPPVSPLAAAAKRPAQPMQD